MTQPRRNWSLWIGLAFVAVLPVNAEIIQSMPLEAVAFVAAAVGSWALLFARDRDLRPVGIGACALAVILAPLPTWPLVVLPLVPRHGGGRDWRCAGVLSGLCILGATMSPEVVQGFEELGDYGEIRLREALALLPVGAKSAVMPWTTPILGVSHRTISVPAFLLAVAVLFVAGVVVVGGARRRWQRGVLLLALGWLAPVVPSILGDARFGFTAPFAWAVASGAGCLLRVVVARAGSLKCQMVAAAACAATVAWIAATAGHATRRWKSWSSEATRWDALFREDPHSRHQWGYAQWLMSQDRGAESRQIAERYLRVNTWDARRRYAWALALALRGESGAALGHLRALPLSRRAPTKHCEQDTLLDVYESWREWDMLFELGAVAARTRAELHTELAMIARTSDRAADYERHIAAALRQERPPLQALEMAYHSRLGRQDVSGLRELGARTVDLYPDAALGYVMLGKAAKIIRADEEMIRWHMAAIERDDGRADVHYDLGLVYHGYKGRQKMAAFHYKRLIELKPAHLRRKQIEAWIAQLMEVEGSGKRGG